MKNLKKLKRNDLKSINGGNPGPTGDSNCKYGWVYCLQCDDTFSCVSPSQEHIFCKNYPSNACN